MLAMSNVYMSYTGLDAHWVLMAANEQSEPGEHGTEHCLTWWKTGSFHCKYTWKMSKVTTSTTSTMAFSIMFWYF